jgi:integrase/recombinase XerD
MTKQHSAASGVLANYLPGFREELTRLGYPDVRADCHLALLADLSRWLEDTGLDPGALTAEVVEQFLTVRREQGHRDLITLIGARPLLDYLIGLGVIRPLARRVPDGPATALLEGYRDYLTYERGLAPHGVERYEQLAQRFVRSVEVDGGIDWAGVSAAEVTRFVVATCSGPGRGSARNLLPALRSFLRFAFLDGWISLPLAQAVPAIAGWRASPLPKGLSRDEVAKLLNSCDRDSARGRRDFAILTLLARLGLRGGEVAIMGLDDIDWRAGEFTVHGKGRRDERLPLPSDVGEAIADYLRLGRPPAVSRTVFLRLYAPQRGLTTQGVTWVVYQACQRAGLVRVGAHRLRHAAASEMLRSGASLAEVGEILRHRVPQTTAIYARVDRACLIGLARPWPGGVA